MFEKVDFMMSSFRIEGIWKKIKIMNIETSFIHVYRENI